MTTLPQHVRQLAAELELLSHGGITAWAANGSGVPESRPPTGEAHPPHQQFLADWERRGESAVYHWRIELRRWRGRDVVRIEVATTDADWIIDDGKGQAPEDVARRFRCTPTRVRRLRVARGLDAETGAIGDRGERAAAMRERGMTQKVIAVELGVSQPTVHRLLKVRKFRRLAA